MRDKVQSSPDRYKNVNSERLMQKIRQGNEQLNVVKQFINNPGTSFFDLQNISTRPYANGLIRSVKLSPRNRDKNYSLRGKIRNSHRRHLTKFAHGHPRRPNFQSILEADSSTESLT